MIEIYLNDINYKIFNWAIRLFINIFKKIEIIINR